MKLNEVIGKTITDIRVLSRMQDGWLDTADCFLVLEKNLIIGIPFTLSEEGDDEVWIREPEKSTESIFKPKKWWQKKHKNADVKNSRIIDILSYHDESQRAFILLDNGKLITEISMAPHGTGHSGLWVYNSLQEVENEFGRDPIRLSEIKEIT
jgi:hypothetical protein